MKSTEPETNHSLIESPCNTKIKWMLRKKFKVFFPHFRTDIIHL